MQKFRDMDFYYDESDGPENEFLTPQEVMYLLYIGRSTFYKLVNSGELPAFRVGKLWRISKKHLEEYIYKCSKK